MELNNKIEKYLSKKIKINRSQYCFTSKTFKYLFQTIHHCFFIFFFLPNVFVGRTQKTSVHPDKT